jgi:hypothetical protein
MRLERGNDVDPGEHTMRRICVLALVLAALSVATSARAEKILYYCDQFAANMANDVIPNAVRLTDSLTTYTGYTPSGGASGAILDSFLNELSSNGSNYDLIIVSVQNAHTSTRFQNLASSVQQLVLNGKKAIYSDVSNSGTYRNENAALFNVAYGGRVTPDTTNHAILANVVQHLDDSTRLAYGLSRPVNVTPSVSRPDLYTWSIISTSADVQVIADYEDVGLGTRDATLLSNLGVNGGQVMINGFANDTVNEYSTDNTPSVELYRYEIDYLLGRAVPEPSTIAGLVGMGLAGLAMIWRRKRAR